MKKPSSPPPIPHSEGTHGDIWVYALISALLAPSAVWIALNHAVWPWDPALYGEVSVDLWISLAHSLRQWCGLMATGLSMKPPGIVWIGQFFVPVGQFFGSIEAGLLLSVLLTQFGLLLFTFKIGQQMLPKSRLVPVAGVVFTAGAQLFVGLSHQFFPEPLQALSVAWVFFVVLKSAQWPKPRIAVHLTGALILGALAKATTPLYCLLPGIYAAFVFLRKPKTSCFADEWRSLPSRLLMVGCGLAGIAGACWYAYNLGYVWQHVRESSSDPIALDYGFRASVTRKLIVWTDLLHQSFLAPYLAWVFLAAALMAVALRVWPGAVRPKWDSGLKLLLWLCLFQNVFLLLVFSTNITVDSRYMFALLPSLAILFMSACAQLASRSVLLILIALCSLQWTAVNYAALRPGDAIAKRSPWLSRFDSSRSRFDELVHLIQITSTVPGRYNIVGVEVPWLNSNSAAFFAAKNRLATGIRCYYTSLGYAQQDPGAALKRIDEFQTLYFITLDETFQPAQNFVNVVSLRVMRELKGSTRFQVVPFASQNGILVLEPTGSKRVFQSGRRSCLPSSQFPQDSIQTETLPRRAWPGQSPWFACVSPPALEMIRPR